MKKQTKWPRPTKRVTRTTQIQGELSRLMDACAVQRNIPAMESIKRKPWLHNISKQDLLFAVQAIARQHNVVL